jgi:hypothetical protein
MKSILIKSMFTIPLVIILLIIAETFYSAVILGNQLIYASIASITLTGLGYLLPTVGSSVLIFAIWRKKK